MSFCQCRSHPQTVSTRGAAGDYSQLRVKNTSRFLDGPALMRTCCESCSMAAVSSAKIGIERGHAIKPADCGAQAIISAQPLLQDQPLRRVQRGQNCYSGPLRPASAFDPSPAVERCFVPWPTVCPPAGKCGSCCCWAGWLDWAKVVASPPTIGADPRSVQRFIRSWDADALGCAWLLHQFDELWRERLADAVAVQELLLSGYILPEAAAGQYGIQPRQ